MNQVARHGFVLAALIMSACAGHPKAAGPVTPAVPAPQPAPSAPVVRIGVILSPSSSAAVKQYGDALLEGIRIAGDAHTQSGQHRVELLVRDDSGHTARAGALITALEADGAVAVIGPIMDAAVNAAASARSSQELVLIAPALTSALRVPNTYAMNREDTAGAALLARYAASQKNRVGILYQAGSPNARDVAAFTDAVTSAGGAAPALQTYPAGTTTFAAPIRKLRDAHVQMLYVPVAARDILQITPQLGYYGLDAVQILGGESWAADPRPRSLTDAMLEGVIAATVLPRNSNDVAWKTFESVYQQTYKRSLTGPIPALGYDAARIILEAAPRGTVSRADIARGIMRLKPIKGATGVLHIGAGAVSRSAFLVRFHGGTWEQMVATGDR